MAMNNIKFSSRTFDELMQGLERTPGFFTLAELLAFAAIVAIALTAPRLGSRFFEAVERRFAPLASSPVQQILAVGALAILARALVLPWLGAPVPAVVHDEQSIYLQAQTFAAGRLANATHPFWEHFETFYVNQIPSYASMYFPGRGAPLALGLLIADNAWAGVWLSVVLMSMAAVWMLQGWVSLPMALLGGVIVVARFGVFSYWINSYYGGAFTALGAMLVVGSLPRILREPRWRYGAVIGLGAAILLLTRPYEGALLCVPVAIFLFARLLYKPALKQTRLAFLKVALPAALFVGAGGALLLAHNVATTGHVFKTPYTLNRVTYANAPAFLISPPIASENRGPAYFREFYKVEAQDYERRYSLFQLALGLAAKLFSSWNFYVGALLTIPFVLGIRQARRNYFLLGTGAFFYAGYALETWNFPHYTAPIFSIFLILTLRGFESLRTQTMAGKPVGLFLARAIPTAGIALLALPFFSVVFGMPPIQSSMRACCAIAIDDFRPKLVKQLRASPGRDLVLVKGRPKNVVYFELVFNEPDIDKSEIVWARRLSEDKDRRLQAYFADRRVWEFEWLPETEAGYRLTALTP